MRIAQICPKYYPVIGGVETFVMETSKRLVERGFEIEILTTDPSGILPKEEIIEDIKVRRFRSYTPKNFYHFSPTMLMELSKSRFDIVHAHGYQDFPAFCGAASKRYNKSINIVTLHLSFSKAGNWIYSIYNPSVGKYIFERATKILIVSPATLTKFPFLFKYQNKVACIPNGVYVSKID
ncbi:MAG: glycosyltransferase family 4 protein [Candidatus Hodarchaeota archaeon]